MNTNEYKAEALEELDRLFEFPDDLRDSIKNHMFSLIDTTIARCEEETEDHDRKIVEKLGTYLVDCSITYSGWDSLMEKIGIKSYVPSPTEEGEGV